MTSPDSFQSLMKRLREGDEDAAAKFVRQYEEAIRRSVRVHLSDPKLHRVLDSMDICQSVLAQFFVRTAAGQFNLDSPAQLLRMLITMARNRVVDQARKQRAARRDVGRQSGGEPDELQNLAGNEATPSRILAGKELLANVLEHLKPDERQLAELRSQGHTWAEISQELGGQPDALRIKLTRALDRVSRQLGMEEGAE